MNMQFHADRLRLRLQAEELEQLLNSESLLLPLGPDAALGQCVLRCEAREDAIFDVFERQFLITVPKPALLDLQSRLPSKSGVSWQLVAEAAFELVLEVDIRKR